MKRKILNVVIPLVVYPLDVMFSFGETDDELTKSLKKYGIDFHEDMKLKGMGKFCISEANRSLIRLNNYPEYPSDYGTLQHEIFHAVTFILDKIGMKFKLLTSDEAYSYLIGYLTTEIYKRI